MGEKKIDKDAGTGRKVSEVQQRSSSTGDAKVPDSAAPGKIRGQESKQTPNILSLARRPILFIGVSCLVYGIFSAISRGELGPLLISLAGVPILVAERLIPP